MSQPLNPYQSPNQPTSRSSSEFGLPPEVLTLVVGVSMFSGLLWVYLISGNLWAWIGITAGSTIYLISSSLVVGSTMYMIGSSLVAGSKIFRVVLQNKIQKLVLRQDEESV